MEKTDLKKEIRIAFSGKKQPQIVDIPPMKYISYEGKGDPNNSPLFEEGMSVLYGIAYTLKFQMKEKGKDFVVSPLEGQWWGEDHNVFTEGKKDEWLWKVMVAVPDYISEQDFNTAKEALSKKKNPAGLDKAEFETLHDGLAVQVLYYGPYSEEGPVIAAMHQHADEQGYRLRGKHREIYMSDPRRTAPEKLKTVIRHPLSPK